ncbi:hypothetical protein F4821DRAFT_226532 [Hypoxylon rubiginosum]|uniref:Uncharacterized protein n=1 Tax=Hypoxylon rubiginosum TaxID=110542 RepID=A0ACC0DGI0_9PEZI|nr:hypothetical protein F4821DRAFT_226532 [Hypoxylon rubiginosum]
MEKKPSLPALTKATNEYRAILERARAIGGDPTIWYYQWLSAYISAKALGVPDVAGTPAVKDFIDAVGARMVPDWATYRLDDHIMNISLGRPTLTLEQISICFIGWIEAVSRHSPVPVIPQNETVARRPDDSNKLVDSQSTSSGHRCPCNKEPREAHPWIPEACGVLQFAITGRAGRKIPQLSDDECEKIRERYQFKRWRSLRTRIEELGWSVKPIIHSAEADGESTCGNLDEEVWSGNMVTAVTRPRLVKELHDAAGHQGPDFVPGVVTALNLSHPLSKSTVLGTDSTVHLVNDKMFFEPGTFKPAAPEADDYVLVGSKSLPIAGTGKRVLRKMVNGDGGPNTVDIILHDVVLVEGFHMNIVSEARLNMSGLWFGGKDCSLRSGTYQNSKLLKRLVRKHNLVFIEYKPIR